MPRMTMIEAIRDAMDVSMGRDENVVVFGEDVGYFGGVFRCTQGLQQKYGTSRCFDTPISEARHRRRRHRHGGLRPAALRRDPVRRLHVSRPTTRSCRRRRACATARTASSPARWWCACRPAAASSAARPTARARRRCSPMSSGLKTVVPSNPYDAKGLLIAAIEDPDPVIFLEPKRLYNGPFDGHHDRPVTPWSKHALGEVPDGHYTVPLGKAAIRRAGAAVTVLAYGTMVYRRRGGRRRDRHRCRDHRSAHPAAARPRHDRGLGREDRALRRRARGDADLAASAPSCRRWCRSIASTISRRRSRGSPAGTRPIRMRRSGTISPGRPASARALKAVMEA